MEEEEVEEASRVERIIKAASISPAAAALDAGEENPTNSTRKLLVKW